MRMLRLPGKLLWRLPGRFAITTLLGPKYSLRCVLFHHIAQGRSPYTDGLGITMPPQQFEECIRFIVRYYTPVSLETVLMAGERLPRRPILVTFDDAYASVAEEAFVVCRRHKVPATFFVNGAFVDNTDLGLDNVLCYAVNRFGIDRFRTAVVDALDGAIAVPESLKHTFDNVLPSLPLAKRRQLHGRVCASLGFGREELANEAQLYVSSNQLRQLSGEGFEIANHTYSHVHCRMLEGPDFDVEIVQNQMHLQKLTGRPVRAFSVPYGSAADVTPALVAALRQSGHGALFLVESLPNTPNASRYLKCRVSMHASSDEQAFDELEVQPRMRAIRNLISRHRRAETRRLRRTIGQAVRKRS